MGDTKKELSPRKPSFGNKDTEETSFCFKMVCLRWGEMTPPKWIIIFFLSGITLITIGVESEALPKDTKPSSVKECRVHIEKALEQYWDKKEPSEKLSSGEDLSVNDQEKDKSEETQITSESQHDTESREQYNENENDDDDNEDDEDETDLDNEKEASNKEETENDDDEDEDDEDENNDSRDSNSEQKQEQKYDETNKNKNGEKHEIDRSKTESSEMNNNKQNDKSSNEPANDEDDDDNDDEDEEEDENEDDDEDEEEVEQDEEKNDIEENDDQENDDDQEDDDQEDDDDQEEEDDDTDIDSSDNKMTSNQRDVHETTETDDEKDNEEENDINDTDEEDEEDSISNETNAETNLQKDFPSDEIHIEIQIEKDKVIGEADSSSVRVAAEFLDEKPPTEQPQATQVEEKNLNQSLISENEDSDEDDDDDQESGSVNELDDDSIENIYEEEDDANSTFGVTYRSRDHIDIILELDEIGTEYDEEEEKLAQSIFKEIKKIHLTQIKPMEMLYKYSDSTTRVLTDAEIFNKPMLIFLGPWSSGKTSIINYLLGIERTPAALKTGTGVTDVDFTLITYGDQKRVTSGTELAADWRYTGLQKFGQGFLDHFRSIQLQHTLLKKITIVDTPGILENKKNAERGYSLSDAFQWFIDRSDAIYVVLDPTKVDIGAELGSIIDQLKGRDARFILNKADTIRRSDLMRVVGQLFWNLSPLMSSTEAPVIYAVSLTTKPYHPSAPAKFLADQEKNFFYDMKDTLDKRVENRILYARRHAVRVRNHAKMVDCYLATYYRHKSIFSSKRNVAKLIIDNPSNYNIFDGLSGMTNVSRNDLPDPAAYKDFFKLHPLYDFKPLASTCSYFRGCPMDKLDLAISKDIPELLAKYKKKRSIEPLKQGR